VETRSRRRSPPERPPASAAISGGTTSFHLRDGRLLELEQHLTFGLSVGTGASSLSATITATANATGLGISAGSQSVSTGTLVFSNSNNITFGMSGSSRVTASYAGPNFDFYANLPVFGISSSMGTTHGQLRFYPIDEQGPFLGNITANTVLLLMSGTGGTASSSSHSYTLQLGIYTVNGASLSLLNSVSSSWGFTAATSASANYVGPRFLTIHSSQWSAQPVLSQAIYVLGINLLSSNFGQQLSFLGGITRTTAMQFSGTVGTSVATATSMGGLPYIGVVTATTNAMPANMAFSDLERSDSLAYFNPLVILNQNGPSAF
jgi:uncharacterized protein (UPF0333 family)